MLVNFFKGYTTDMRHIEEKKVWKGIQSCEVPKVIALKECFCNFTDCGTL